MSDDLHPTWLLGATERGAVRWKTGHSSGPRLQPRIEQLRAGALAIHPDLRGRIRQPRHDAARHVIEQVGRSAALLDPPNPAGTGPRPEVGAGALPAQRAGLFDLRRPQQPGPAGPVAPFAAAAPGQAPPAPPRPQPAAPPPPPEGQGEGMFDPFFGLVPVVKRSER